jgi:hypothetical protein
VIAQPGHEPSPAVGTWRAVALVSGATGIVALGAGAYFGAEARSKNDASYAQGCVGDNCTAGAAATRRDALSAASASTALFISGGLLTAAGVTLWFLAPSLGGGGGVALVPGASGSRGPVAGLTVEGAWW